ncbi:hypothetical protein HMF8227_01200 [Saliniradius amylolyticus]|uniref:Uncharacterized protein n=1 Tax=Saliniradius amylolyticus TaxID=2183582 RepID=A0A2S2E208_9ALTE|nr:XrtA system polysaccharide chain length determinant [Saliniradius amylolyticus]AWL11681.1 hypothetical protein HMF8227_01200 [Saliniradius amylolyticus]
MEHLQQLFDDLIGYVRGIWVKKRIIMLTSWLICPLAWLAIAIMPDVYQASAKVYADTNSILQPLLKGVAIQTNADHEVQLMARTLLTHPNLEKIVRQTDMDLNAKNEKEFVNIVEHLKEKIDIDSTGRANIYTISYQNKDPQLAKTVVEETLNLFVESTLGSTRQDSHSANRFLNTQIAEYEQRLSEAEQRLADFKRNNGQYLSSNNTGYYEQKNQLKDELDAIELEIAEVESRLTQAENAMKQARQALRQQNSTDNVSITTKYDERIKTLRTRLDELMIRFTENHPDVIETQNLLTNLEQMRAQEIQEFERQLESDRDITALSKSAVGETLMIRVQQLRNELASLEVRKSNYQQKLEDLEAKIDVYPQIEAQLTALNRDYGITKKKYEELLSRRESAKISQQAELQQDDIQFRVIDPPRTPLTPSGPNRLLLHSAVLVFGFGAGIGLAFLISQIHPIALSPGQLSAATQLPVFGVVSHVDIQDIAKAKRRKLFWFWTSNITLLAGYLGFIVLDLTGHRLDNALLNKIFQHISSQVAGLV